MPIPGETCDTILTAAIITARSQRQMLQNHLELFTQAKHGFYALRASDALDAYIFELENTKRQVEETGRGL